MNRPCLNLGSYLIVDAYSLISSIFSVVDVPVRIISIPANGIYLGPDSVRHTVYMLPLREQ